MNHALRRAYRLTRYEVAGVVFTIGRRAPQMDRLLLAHGVRVATFVTAFNPYSRRMPPRWNHRMQKRLVEAMHQPAALDGSGCWRGWCEAHVLRFGDPRPALVLARRFRQNAVVVVRLRQTARLLLTGE